MHPYLFIITIHEGWYYFYAEITILKGRYMFYSLTSLPLLSMSLDKEVGCLEIITKPLNQIMLQMYKPVFYSSPQHFPPTYWILN